MFDKYKSFLYTLDLIGPSPQLLIFKNQRYKSMFSSLVSILIILFSIFFALYSFIEYSKFDSPFITYYRENDEVTNRSFLLNDKLLMFQLIGTNSSNYYNSSIGYFKGLYFISYNNGTNEIIPLNISKCEFGKNVDYSYSNIISKDTLFGKTIEQFYCIDYNGNLSLFYHPKIGFSFISLYVILKNGCNVIPEHIQSFIVTENNIINHSNKDNPIRKSSIFEYTTAFSSIDSTSINYKFQYIKYESDNGLLFKMNKHYNGMIFSNMNFYKINNIDIYLNNNLDTSSNSLIGTIVFMINQSNFDIYKRSYQRLQSLLAEIMSVISLLFQIGEQISYILCNKKMSKDILVEITNKSKIDLLTQRSHDINKLFKKERKIIKSKSLSTEKPLNEIDYLEKEKENNFPSEKKNIKSKSMEKPQTNKYNSEKNENNNSKLFNNSFGLENNNEINISNKLIKDINYFHIIKSYFCFKDKKTKMINLCHNIITKDICIERILERLYNLEKSKEIIKYNYNNNDDKMEDHYLDKNKEKT